MLSTAQRLVEQYRQHLLVPIARRTASPAELTGYVSREACSGGDLAVGLEAHLHAVSSPPTGPATAAARTAMLYVGLHRQPRCCPALDHLDAGLRQSPKQRRADTMVTAGHMVRRWETSTPNGSERLPRRSGRRRPCRWRRPRPARELGLPVAGLKGGTARSTRSGLSTSEPSGSGARGKRFENARSTSTPTTTSSPRISGRSSGSLLEGPDRDRFDRRDRNRDLPSPDRADGLGLRLRLPGRVCSPRRVAPGPEHHRGSM